MVQTQDSIRGTSCAIVTNYSVARTNVYAGYSHHFLDRRIGYPHVNTLNSNRFDSSLKSKFHLLGMRAVCRLLLSEWREQND